MSKKLQKSFCDLDHCVSLYEYGTCNSHHKVLVNLHASNMDALKNQNWPMLAHIIRFAKFERTFNKVCTMRGLNCCLSVTDHATRSVTVGRIYVRSTAMRRNNVQLN